MHWILENRSPSANISEVIKRHSGKKLIVLTTHRRESFGTAMKENLRALAGFMEGRHDSIVIFPVHPNPNVRKVTHDVLDGAGGFEIIDPLDYADFIHLLSAAWLIVSDSGGIQEEAPGLGKRLIVLRRNTERPEVVHAGVAKLIGDNPVLLKETLESADNDLEWSDAAAAKQDLYGTGDAADQIVEALAAIFANK